MNATVADPKRKRERIPTAKQILALRKRLGLTQAEAAAKVRVNQNVWSDWEADNKKPSQQSAYLLRLMAEGNLPE